MSHPPFDFRALLDKPADDTPCACGGCQWKGAFKKLYEIYDCSLTVGDEVPAGRCPMCESLAYVEKLGVPA